MTAIPACIGQYRILRVLGHGGMGTVYLAEQDAPIRRQVALKVLRDGLESPRAAARFDVEREALALMEHPHIAHVFDAGVAEDGRPWVAMEYVRGKPINDYCTEEGLDLEARLGLMIDVCAAVSHAHQKGMIHRDLKPTNVLVAVVDGRPDVKVIDFGLARRVAGSALARGVLTEGGMLIGTPAYMSPEQAAGRPDDVDTRTDVYGLGVLLYELVTGEVPHGPPPSEQVPFFELLDQVLREDPLPPSARVSTHDADTMAQLLGGRLDVSTLRRQLAGDLDRVVLKALEKDRDRRYATVRELAADIRRFLAHEPVLAAPPSTAYRIRKFVRRHRVAVGAAAAVLVALTAGLVTSLMLYGEATEARDVSETALLSEIAARRDARDARDDAEGLVGFMLTDLRDELVPLGQLELLGDVARQAQAYYEDRAQKSLSPDELVGYARALQGVGEVLRQQGDLDQAVAAYRSSVALGDRVRTQDPDDAPARAVLATGLTLVGQILREQGDLEGALASCRRSMDLSEPLLADHPGVAEWQDDLASSLNVAGDVWTDMGDIDEALECYRRSAKIRSALAESEPEDADRQEALSNTLGRIAKAYREKGELAAAMPAARQALDIRRQLAVAEPGNERWQKNLSHALSGVGQLYSMLSETEPALAHLREALEILSRLTERDPRNVLWQENRIAALQFLGDALIGSGASDEALTSYRAAANAAQDLVARSPSHSHFGSNLHLVLARIASTHVSRGEPSEALEILDRCVAYFRGRTAEDPADKRAERCVADMLVTMGHAHAMRGDPDAALEQWEAACEIFERLIADDTRDHVGLVNHAQCLVLMATALARGGASADAWERFDGRLETLLQRIEAHPSPRPDLQNQHAGLLAQRAFSAGRRGDLPGALAALRESVRVRAELADLHPKRVLWRAELALAHIGLAGALFDLGDQPAASEHARRSVALLRGVVADDPDTAHWQSQLAQGLMVLSQFQWKTFEFEAALESLREHADILERLTGAHPDHAVWRERLTASRASLDQLERGAAKAHLSAATALVEKSQFAAAARHFEAALRDDGIRNDLEHGNLYNASRAAARAAAESEDVDEKARLTGLALDWLEADVALGTAAIGRETSKKARRRVERIIARHTEHVRRDDPAFESLRGSPDFEALFERKSDR